MKRIVKFSGITMAVVLMSVFMVSMANAQNRPSRRPPMLPDSTHVIQMVNQLSGELSLTESQKTQIINLQLDHFKQMKSILEKDKVQHKKTRVAMDSLRDDMRKQMATILNSKQQKQFNDFMESHRPPREDRPAPRP
jgi:Spy/CpxP family protein refolding chaperone